MILPIVQVGNSRGIRLPKSILQRLNFEDKVEMIVNNDELVIKIAKIPLRSAKEARIKTVLFCENPAFKSL